MSYIQSRAEFLNEKIQVKRKYTDNYPAQFKNETGVRNKVLEFIFNKGTVTKQEINEFFNSLKETMGKKPSSSFLRDNSYLFSKNIDENGEVSYSLTNRGRQAYKDLSKRKINEDFGVEDIENENENEIDENVYELDETDDINEMKDEDNPQFLFHEAPNDLLVRLLKKKPDLFKFIENELAGRGYDKNGKWVGFDKVKYDTSIYKGI